MKPTTLRSRLRGASLGQAMTEYAIILAALSALAGLPIPGTSKSFTGAAIDAYRDYYISYYYVLNLPFP